MENEQVFFSGTTQNMDGETPDNVQGNIFLFLST